MEGSEPRKFRGPATWAKVRRDYLSGIAGRIVAKKHDVTHSNLKRRARPRRGGAEAAGVGSVGGASVTRGSLPPALSPNHVAGRRDRMRAG